MFQSKVKGDDLLVGAGASATIIASGTLFKGNIDCKGDIRIDGTLIGHIVSQAKVVIGALGSVQGNIEGHQADIMGMVTGNIKVKELLQLKGQSNINGNLSVGKLQIDMTASFNGHCVMHPIVAANGMPDEAKLPA